AEPQTVKPHMSEPRDFPNDADGDAMRRVIAGGSNLDRPMSIDFTVHVPDGHVVQEVAVRANQLGYVTKVSQDEEDWAWTCYCKKSMLLQYPGVPEPEAELNEAAEPLGGFCDGWGTFGNVGSHNGAA